MDRKRLVIIFTSVFLFLLLLIIVLLLIFKPFASQPVVVSEPEIKIDENIDQTVDQLPAPSSDRLNDDNSYPLGVKQFALAYAERFASYSSDAKFKNLEDLKDVSTSKMIQYLDNLIATSIAGINGYEAVEARALSSKLSYTTGSEAMVIVSVQLSRYNDSRSEFTSSNGKLEVKAIKVGDNWQADEVSWQ